MRTPTISSAFYAPGVAPSNEDDFRMWVEREFKNISAVLNLLAAGHIEKTYAAPAKPREGDIRLADGTQWNPGSGAGTYAYYNSAWHFLG